jgi:thioredoxin-like negative regulator of GroEL
MSVTYNPEVLRRISDRDRLFELICNIRGPLVIKFGATWCKPCKKIANDVAQQFNNAPNTWICCDLDVDDNTDVYSYYKKNKQVTGIPAILCIMPNSLNGIPVLTFSGTNKDDLDNFFREIRRITLNM